MGLFDKIGKMAGELMAGELISSRPKMPKIDPSQAGELMMPGVMPGPLNGLGRAIGGVGRSIGGLLGGLGDIGPMAGEIMAPMPHLPSDFLPNIDPSVAGEIMAPLPHLGLPSDFLPNIDPTMLGELMNIF